MVHLGCHCSFFALINKTSWRSLSQVWISAKKSFVDLLFRIDKQIYYCLWLLREAQTFHHTQNRLKKTFWFFIPEVNLQPKQFQITLAYWL